MAKELFLIDGYNVICRWRYMQGGSLRTLAEQRDQLVARLVAFKDFHDTDMTIVFDASSQKYGGPRTDRWSDVEILYSRQGQTADAVIEKIVAQRRGVGRVTVVTSDRQVALLSRGYGALCWSAEQMGKELQALPALWQDVAAEHSRRFLSYGPKNKARYPIEDHYK